jgi:hypothetical protein
MSALFFLLQLNKSNYQCLFQEVPAASEGAEIPRRAPVPGRFCFEALDGS